MSTELSKNDGLTQFADTMSKMYAMYNKKPDPSLMKILFQEVSADVSEGKFSWPVFFKAVKAVSREKVNYMPVYADIYQSITRKSTRLDEIKWSERCEDRWKGICRTVHNASTYEDDISYTIGCIRRLDKEIKSSDRYSLNHVKKRFMNLMELHKEGQLEIWKKGTAPKDW